VSSGFARVDAARVRALREQLDRELGAALVVKDDGVTLEAYGRDESGLGPFLADLVVFPSDTAQVQAVIRACQRHAVPVVPVGARTGKSGGSLPVCGGVALALEKMNRILQVDPDDLVAVVQPGVVLGALVAEVESKGLFYPPDPNSWETCTLGGNVAENAGGPRALKYGVTRDYVLALEWVLPSGEVVRAGHRTAKGVAGYDLVGLFVGSEGTLGVATEITLRLLPKPRAVRVALVSFRTVADATGAVGRVLSGGFLPRALELLDDVVLRAVAGKGVSFHPESRAVLLIELDGTRDDAVLEDLLEVAARCEEAGALDTQVAQDEAQREALWRVRRLVSPGLRALCGGKLSEDVVVPRSRISEAVERFKAIGARHGLVIATYGHAGDGNLHTNVLFSGPEDNPRVQLALDEIMGVTLLLGGTITGEHGVGLAKKKYLPGELGPSRLALERAIRVTLDPEFRLNPGKLFEQS
jgi:glycolate oxidase